jgi:hypothetical protein
VFRLRDQLVVFPADQPAPGFLFRWLFGSLQWTMSLPPGAGGRHDFPVLCCDPQSGRVVQRLNFRHAPTPALVRARLTEEATLLPTLLGTRDSAIPPRSNVYLCQGRLVVALPGVLWAVAGDKQPSAPPND